MESSSNGADTKEGIGSLRTAINFYGERIHGRKQEKNKGSIPHSQEKAQAELELFHAKNAVKALASKIEQSNARAKAWKLELQSLRNSEDGSEDPHYPELIQQLDVLKQDLSRLRLEVSSVLESKAKAEKDIQACNLKASSCLNSLEELRKEIDEANEEHVLVELARIEAEKELREIESLRTAEAMEFSKKMEAAKKRIEELQIEISMAKELEEKFAITNADVGVLQSEMELVRAMEKNFKKEVPESNTKRSGAKEQLQIVEDELRNEKKVLESIKEEGFQFMTSMDIVRNELLRVSMEANRLKEIEKNSESTIKHLNSKLLKARSKLDTEISAEERTRGIVSNLTAAFQQLHTEVDNAKKEKEKTSEETMNLKNEIEKTEMDINAIEEKLQGTILELGAAKASEAVALEKLKSMMESIVKRRALPSQHSSMICVTKWEYEYLSRKADSAQAVADKKVAAIQAWIKALRAQEKEILLESELIGKEIKAMRAAEKGIFNMEKVVAAEKLTEEANEFMDILKAGMPNPRKSFRENSMIASRRRSKVRRVSAMQGIKSAARSPSLTIKKRNRVMPTFATLLRTRSGRKKK